MYVFRVDVHNLLDSATQSNAVDPLNVYATCLRQLFDRYAPLVTVSDRGMTLKLKQAEVQRRLAQRNAVSLIRLDWEIYSERRNLVSNMISLRKSIFATKK